MIFSHFILL